MFILLKNEVCFDKRYRQYKSINSFVNMKEQNRVFFHFRVENIVSCVMVEIINGNDLFHYERKKI